MMKLKFGQVGDDVNELLTWKIEVSEGVLNFIFIASMSRRKGFWLEFYKKGFWVHLLLLRNPVFNRIKMDITFTQLMKKAERKI